MLYLTILFSYTSQCKRYHEGKLPQVYVDRLLAIGFDFVRMPPKPKTPNKSKSPGGKREPPIGLNPQNREQYLEELWMENYNKLAAIYEQQGNCDIPMKYEQDPSLGAWVFAQKLSKKKGKLSDERLEKLQTLGFKF